MRRSAWPPWAGTLPDLDVFIDHGYALRNMVLHRAESHALVWLTLALPVLAALPARFCCNSGAEAKGVARPAC